MNIPLGAGTTEAFFAAEYDQLDLRDKRLNTRAKKILTDLQKKLTSCIRRLYTEGLEARQAYDFF